MRRSNVFLWLLLSCVQLTEIDSFRLSLLALLDSWSIVKVKNSFWPWQFSTIKSNCNTLRFYEPWISVLSFQQRSLPCSTASNKDQERPSIIRSSTSFHVHPPFADVAKKLGYALLGPCQFLLTTAVELYPSSTWYVCSRNFTKLYVKIFTTKQERNGATLLIVTELKFLRGITCFLLRKVQHVHLYDEGISEISQ